MTTREEALGLAMEAGFSITDGVTDYADADSLVHLVDLSRQRPGWVWVPEEPTRDMLREMEAAEATYMGPSQEDPFGWERGSYKAALAAAPSPDAPKWMQDYEA